MLANHIGNCVVSNGSELDEIYICCPPCTMNALKEKLSKDIKDKITRIPKNMTKHTLASLGDFIDAMPF